MQYIRLGKSDLRHQVSMAEISLAWLLTKVTSPVVGATKKRSCRRRGKCREPSTEPGGDPVSGRYLSAARSDGAHGAKRTTNERR